MNWQLYGARGWGSTLAEAALAWVGAPVEFIDVEGFDKPGPQRERLLAVNPLARVPTLVAPNGDIMTESAAIMLRLDELYPDAVLAPSSDGPLRAAYLDRLIWFVSVLYPTFSYRDYPERWAPSAPGELTESADAFRQSLWLQFEAEIGAGEWVLGEQPTALDIYVSVMTHWRPRRGWIAANCPRLHRVALATDALPALAPVMARNFP